jgi:molybdate transport system substrate-binding protein
LFEKLGVAGSVMPKSRKIKGPPSGEAVASVVARGDAEIGFQQVSELLGVPGVTFVGAIPGELQQDTYFSAGVGSKVTNADAAAALLKFLASAEAAPYMTKAGLAPLAK